ncbi:MAG: matrixin family metalloprotease [archaeon]
MVLSIAIAAKPAEKQKISFPPAAKISDNVYYLGHATENGKSIEGYAIVHYKKAPGKPGTTCGDGVCDAGENVNKCPADCGGSDPTEPDTSSCYEALARGAVWKTVEPYVVNPANSQGIAEAYIAENLGVDITKWEGAAGADILGDGSTTSEVLEADMVSTDGRNEVYFGSIDDSGAIAVTIIWGVFGGPPKGRMLIEWDMIFDEMDFSWSVSGEAGKMDFENIATHELGHSAGLADLYDGLCGEQTMYGYAGYGETKKRTLESGDITGIQSLY